MKKYIAVDIDDTLNNFTETLKSAEFTYYDKEVFDKYIEAVRNDVYEEDNVELDNLRFSIHCQCYTLATARHDAVEFMQWLKSQGYKIVLMTYRDLRHCLDETKEWMKKNKIPFDYIFSTDNKALMCKAWKIPILIDDANTNIMVAPPMGIDLYYPILPHNKTFVAECIAINPDFIGGGKGFNDFKEVKAWMTK
ncbi:hypothetical protein [Anaerospora hongkongensis]|uniref:hypothetical protein n=1 Tax=Anaerospora hongkongensis TaxID=244830 RepID=UPI002898DF60|nr:hypothetical protein [Anaerospora hongkongensis]